jgi:hypothetical protein
LRHFSGEIHYLGGFYGQTDLGSPYKEGISVDGLIGILKSVPAGTTELGCHPGEAADLHAMYRDERAIEVRTLCDPRLRALLRAERIELRPHEIRAQRAHRHLSLLLSPGAFGRCRGISALKSPRLTQCVRRARSTSATATLPQVFPCATMPPV